MSASPDPLSTNDDGSRSAECPHCRIPMQPFITGWTWVCRACGLQAARHAEQPSHIGWDAVSAESLAGLRVESAQRLLQALEKHTSLSGKRLLDIGCAAGWFLRQARAHGLVTLGIEPDAEMVKAAQLEGLEVRHGYFPQALESGEQFDLVSFNDVFEHLPDPADALDEVARRLPSGGHLLLNLPCAGGVLYRVASLLARLGYRAPFERFWQCGYESPHLYYFDHRNLRALVEARGFRLVGRVRIAALAVRGLWARINEDQAVSLPMAVLIWCAVVVASPALRFLLPNDIMVHIYERYR